MSTISLVGLDKAAVLAALYNASRPLGMGFLQYDPAPMTVEDAKRIGPEQRFDYLKGRVMKIDLTKDDLYTDLYNRDNGPGKAEKIVEELRRSHDVNTASIQASHKTGVKESAGQTLASCERDHTFTEENFGNTKIKTIRMGMSDVANIVTPKVEEALKNND